MYKRHQQTAAGTLSPAEIARNLQESSQSRANGLMIGYPPANSRNIGVVVVNGGQYAFLTSITGHFSWLVVNAGQLRRLSSAGRRRSSQSLPVGSAAPCAGHGNEFHQWWAKMDHETLPVVNHCRSIAYIDLFQTGSCARCWDVHQDTSFGTTCQPQYKVHAAVVKLQVDGG